MSAAVTVITVLTVDCVTSITVITVLTFDCVTAVSVITMLLSTTVTMVGRGSSVGIATGYGLDGPGIESRWGEIFRTCPDRPWGPPSLLYNVHRVLPGGK